MFLLFKLLLLVKGAVYRVRGNPLCCNTLKDHDNCNVPVTGCPGPSSYAGSLVWLGIKITW